MSCNHNCGAMYLVGFASSANDWPEEIFLLTLTNQTVNFNVHPPAVIFSLLGSKTEAHVGVCDYTL